MSGDYYAPEIECASADRWRAYQDGLVETITARAFERTSAFAGRLERAGVRQSELRKLADLARLPVLSKDALPKIQEDDPPFGGLLACEPSALRRVYTSPGPILDPEGDGPDYWGWAPPLWAAGFRRGDRVYNTFSYHLTPAGAMMDEGLRALRCTVVPGGVGNTDAQVEFLARSESTGYCGTPQFLRTLLDKARARNVELGLTRAFVSGAPLPPSLREELERDFAVSVRQGYGTADVGAIGYECDEVNGWHVAPGRIVEVLEPGTGEVVVSVDSDVYPLVRFGTGDVSSLDGTPCSCGRTTPRLLGFQGRVGEGVKVRGLFVHPRQIARVLESVFDELPRFQAVVRAEGRDDSLVIRVEAAREPSTLAERMRSELKLRVTIELVAAGAIAADAPRVRDERRWD